ncbi:MAG: hypothetical protein JXR86_16920 [Spirochaetales bacterium]|nr:hypothetical protein [Spirochaetales bacterium]
MTRSDQSGYSSVSALILLLFLSTLALGVIGYSRSAANQYLRIEALYERREILETAMEELIARMSSDPTPDADAPSDPVWSWIENRSAGEPQVKLEDISSRFNLNFMRTAMLENSSFSSMMINGKSPEDLKQNRGERGFATDLAEGYGEYFSEEDLRKYFTVYSYANLNVTYEDSLKKLYEIRIDEGGALLFLSEIQSLIATLIMADEQEMDRILGAEKERLYPLINIEPLINVNFAEEEILKAVLYYPYRGTTHEKAGDFLEIIRAERSVLEIDGDRLSEILPDEEEYLRIRQYLGTRTWFWKASVEYEEAELTVIFARLPEDREREGGIPFRIIEWQFLTVEK